jgi:predicted amidophosphoribosyltransferase
VRFDERMFVGAIDMRCNGCGAELQLGPDRCPLCGEDAHLTSGARKREKAPSVDDYQQNVRALRKQLKRLRDDGAEAV